MATKVLNGLDLTNQRIINVGSPSATTDAVNKTYVDQLLQGLTWKQPVRAATTASGTLTTAYANGSTIDGYTLVTGDRILIKDQSTGSENGIYTVNASGAPTRALDADSTAELQNATVYVITGTVNADKAYTQTANDPTVGTTALVWAQVGGSGGSYTNGTGLTLTGSTFAIDTAVVVRKYSVNVPSGSTSAAITHGLATTEVLVQVYEISGGAVVQPDVTITNSNTVTLTFATAPTSGQYRAVVHA